MRNISLRWVLLLLISLHAGDTIFAQTHMYSTKYVSFSVNNAGYIKSIKDKISGKEYYPKGDSSAILSLTKNNVLLLPVSASFDKVRGQVTLQYPNESTAIIQVVLKGDYLKFQLLSLSPGNGVDNIIWGPYKTTISKTIGEIISVVRDDKFAIGMMALDDNTTSGPPSEGDLGVTYYYIHSPDPKKYPLPANLTEGQCFKIGGDGLSDIAFYSQPEEYYRMNYGNGAALEPAYGSWICMHSRDRRREQMIRYPVLPEGVDGGYNSARYQLVPPIDAGFEGSAIALYGCPDSLGLHTIEKIVLAEGLPHPEVDGKWVKDPASFKPDIAWWGAHDSLASYAGQLGLKAVQDEGWGEYYPNPANRWTKRKIGFTNGPSLSIPEFGASMQHNGIRYGLHTLCEFLQPDNNSDVAPVPNDSLAIMQRTTLVDFMSASDTMIRVADTCYFNEFGGWEGNHTNVLKIGKELIEYNGITSTKPYTFLHVKRGLYGSAKGSYKPGDTIVKLQPNCYRGFVPDMNLQQDYADYYGSWLREGGMDYIDFDGLESCMYQGQGQYSFKQFFRKLFDSYERNGGKYLRVMGSCVYEGNWHYMSVCNVGGGDRMFSPVLNKWGIEGKDMRYVFESNYFPATFGIIDFDRDWSLYDAENLQAKSIGWNATYMLGLSQQSVEASGNKQAIFNAFRVWENARARGVFTRAQKEKLKDLSYKFHLEQHNASSFMLYTLKENRQVLPYSSQGVSVSLQPEGAGLYLPEWTIRVQAPENVSADGIRIIMPGGSVINLDERIPNGQFIVWKEHELYLADKGRKKLKQIKMDQPLLNGKGLQEIRLSALHEGDNKIKLELVTTVVVKKERVGK